MNRHEVATRALRTISRMLRLALSVGMVMLGIPANALAQTTSSGSGGSIVVDIVDPATGKLVGYGLESGGTKTYEIRAKAFDSLGRSISCTPTFDIVQGISGNQIEGIDRTPQGDIIKLGRGFGSAEIITHCAELPDVVSKTQIFNLPKLTAPQIPKKGTKEPQVAKGTQEANDTQAVKPKPHHTGVAVFAAVLLAGAAAAAVVVAAGKSNDTSSSSSNPDWVYANWNCNNVSGCIAATGHNLGSAGPFCSLAACNTWHQTYVLGTCTSTPVYAIYNAPASGTCAH